MNIASPITTGYAVDTSRGEIRTDLQKQWMARPADQRFTSLSSLEAAVKARAEASRENRIDTRKLEIIAPEARSKDDIHHLSVGLPNGDEVAPTHWSFGQLATLAKAPAGYLRTIPSQISADALTYGLRYCRGDIEQIKTYHTGDELLAATGPDYGRVFDYDVVAAVRRVAGDGIGDTRWKVPGEFDWRTRRYDPDRPITVDSTTLYASDRDVFIFLVDDKNPIEVGKLPNGDPDYIFRGFYVANSEVGSRSLIIASFFLRGACMNRLMIGVENFEEIRMVHSKMAPSRFIEQAAPALAAYADGSVAKISAGIERAKEAKVAENDEEMLAFLNARAGSRSRAKAMLELHEQEEGFPARSVWDAGQAMTAYARGSIYQDERVTLEREAGKLLTKAAA